MREREEVKDMLNTEKDAECGADLSTMPNYEMNRFALWVAKMAEEYFKDPGHQKELEEYKREKAKKLKSTEMQLQGQLP